MTDGRWTLGGRAPTGNRLQWGGASVKTERDGAITLTPADGQSTTIVRFADAGGQVHNVAAYPSAQAAVTAALAGGTVFFPDGDHPITTPLVFSGATGLRITGAAGARLVPTVGDAAAITGTGCTDVVVDGFTIDASGAGAAACGVAFYGSTNCHVRRMAITGIRRRMAPSGMAVLFSGCTHATVDRCYLHANGYGGGAMSLDVLLTGACVRCDVVGCHCASTEVQAHVGLEDADFCRVMGNTLEGARSNTVADGFGYGVYLYGTAVGVYADHCQVVGNVIRDLDGDAVYVQRTRRLIIAQNQLYNTCQNVSGGTAPEGAVAINNLSMDILVQGNVVDTGAVGIRTDAPRTQVLGNMVRNLTAQAIALDDAVDGSVILGNVVDACAVGIGTGFASLAITGLVVADNTVTGCTGAGSGITLDDVDQLVCTGNICRSNGGYGINLSNCDDGEVGSNTCAGNNVANGGYDGLSINGTCDNLNVHHNRSTGTSQAYGIRIAGSGHSLTDNQVKGNGTAGTIDTATTTTRRGNRYTTGALQGTATLGVGGTVTVNTAEIRAGDTVMVARLTPGGATIGHLSAPVASIVAGTSFVVNSSDAADRSVVVWEIVH